MNKINFKNLPSTDTPVNANNLNTMQDNIEAEIDAINASADTQRQLYAKGWYRIAKASTKIATACIIKLGTSYSNQTPMTAIMSIATSHDTASISLLDCQLKGSNVHFSKARIQYDSTNGVHYLDVYYEEENLTNTMHANLIAKDGFWKITESTDVTEYTTLCEVNTTVKKSIIHAYLAENQTLTTDANQYAKIPLSDTFVESGGGLTLSNGSIVIGKGISIIKISTSVTFNMSSFEAEKAMAIIIVKNSSPSSTYQKAGYFSNKNYQNIAISDAVLEVTEGDTISIYARTIASTNTEIVVNNGRYNTMITAEVVR